MKGCVVNVRNKLLTGKVWTLQVGEDKVNDNFNIQKLGKGEVRQEFMTISSQLMIIMSY